MKNNNPQTGEIERNRNSLQRDARRKRENRTKPIFFFFSTSAVNCSNYIYSDQKLNSSLATSNWSNSNIRVNAVFEEHDK